MEWDTDELLPAVSLFRSHVLNAMAVEDKGRACLINQRWYAAGCEPSSWTVTIGGSALLALLVPATGDPDSAWTLLPAVACNPSAVYVARKASRAPGFSLHVHHPSRVSMATARSTAGHGHVFQRDQFGVPFRFSSPLMYPMVRQAAAVLHGCFVFPNAEADVETDAQAATYVQVARLFDGGGAAPLYGLQYPAAHVLLRTPSILTLPPPPGVAARHPGYGDLPLYLLIVAQLVKEQLRTPRIETVPWLLSLAWWAAENQDPAAMHGGANDGDGPRTAVVGSAALPFHKLLASPLLCLAGAGGARPPARGETGDGAAVAAPLRPVRLSRVSQLYEVLAAAVAMTQRYASELVDQLNRRLAARATILSRLESTDALFLGAAAREGLASELAAQLGVQLIDVVADEIRLNLPPRLHPRFNRPGGGEKGAVGGLDVTAIEVLADTDPRLLFSVFAYLADVYPRMAPCVLQRVKLHFGEAGELEVRGASRRIAVLERTRQQLERAHDRSFSAAPTDAPARTTPAAEQHPAQSTPVLVTGGGSVEAVPPPHRTVGAVAHGGVSAANCSSPGSPRSGSLRQNPLDHVFGPPPAGGSSHDDTVPQPSFQGVTLGRTDDTSDDDDGFL